MTMYLVLSDLQIPYHNADLFETFLRDGAALNVDKMIIIGDFVDFPSVSTFSKATADEYASKISEEVSIGTNILSRIRDKFPSCDIYFHTGNHEERIMRYVKKYAPALAGMTELNVSSLLRFSEYGIMQADKYHVHEDAFVSTHGHLGSLKPVAGMTALASAKSVGLPVVCGHTHRLGITYASSGVDYLGTRNTVWGMEVGHMMDLRKVHYKKDDVLNWQAGYGFVTVDYGIARPFVIQMPN